MTMNTELEKAGDLWEAVRSEDDLEKRRTRMIELAGLLLKQAAPDTDKITELSGSDLLTDFFIEFLNAGETAGTFFEQALDHLEDELKGGEFETQVRETQDQLDKTVGRLNELKEQNRDLLARKEHLLAESETLNALETELETLKHLESGLKPENLEALSEEVRQLSEKTEKLIPEKERLETELGDLKPACKDLEETIDALESEKAGDVNRMSALSKNLAGIIDNAWDEYDKRLAAELGKLKQKNIAFLEIAAQLDKAEKEVRDAVEAEKAKLELFESHFSANKAILQAAERPPGPDGPVQNRVDRAKTLAKEIDRNLSEFDTELKEILIDVEEKVNRIRRLNKTG